MPDAMNDPGVQAVGRAIGEHLADIAPLFKPGVRLTFLARHPDFPDGSRDMVLTDDTLSEAIAALQIRRKEEAANAAS